MTKKETITFLNEDTATIYRDEETKELSLEIRIKELDKQIIIFGNDAVQKLSYLLEFWAPTH